MKDILISLKPYFYYLIGEGIKTMEVRKSMPKADDWSRNTWFYMSKDENSFAKIPKELQDKYRKHFGKIGLKFVCDKIYDITPHFDTPTFPNQYICGWEYGKEFDCLSFEELTSYLNGKQGYGWHISDLVIYDKPKELGEFIVPSKIGCCNEGKCRGCKYLDRGNGFNVEDDCNAKFNTDEYKPLRKAPQSWCYVEEADNV